MAALSNVGIALNEVILSMKAQIEDQTQAPVFLMKDFKKLYQKKLSCLEAPPDFIDNVHVTRLKKEIKKKTKKPRLCEHGGIKDFIPPWFSLYH